MKRRDFLMTSAVAGAAWMFAGELALAQVKWEEELESVRIDGAEGTTITDKSPLGKGPRNWSPKIAIDTKGLIWLAWISERQGSDRVLLTSFDGNAFGKEIPISESTAKFALDPALCVVGDSLYIAWIEPDSKGSTVLVREVRGGEPQPIKVLREGLTHAFRPAFSIGSGGQVSVFCETRQVKGATARYAPEIYPVNESAPKDLWNPTSGEGDARRIAATTDGKGKRWIAWDEMVSPGSTRVYIAQLDKVWRNSLPVTHHPAANLAPSLASDEENRLWIAWHSNRRGRDQWDIPRWFHLRCYKDGEFYDPAGEPTSKNLDKEGTDQGFEFTRVFCARDGKIIVTGRASHNFLIQYYHGDQWSPLYRLPEDGWGGRGQFLEGALDKDDNLWVVRRDLNACVLQKITLPKLPRKKPRLVLSREKEDSAPKLVNIQTAPKRWPAYKDAEGVNEPLSVFYGDIHGHTWTSDGVGDVDEYYYTRRDYYQDDFCSLTDHDTFVGQSIARGQYEFQKAITEHFNQDGRFVTLFGQEYTTPRVPKGVGHKCLYSTNPDFPLFDHDRPEWAKTADLYAGLKKWNAIVIPHHVGWTGSDWENFDPEVMPSVEIVSNHGRFEYMGNRPIPHRGGIKGQFVQDILARGIKLGIIGGSDGHGLIWHHHAGWKRDSQRTGLACVLAPDLSRQSIFDAIRKRRTFGTTGVKPRIDFRVNNHLMGDEFTTSEKKVSMSVDIATRDDVKWLTIVKNNKDFHEAGGEGFTMKYSLSDPDLEVGTSWYYLRVEFESGDMAWTSPIWVTRKA